MKYYKNCDKFNNAVLSLSDKDVDNINNEIIIPKIINDLYPKNMSNEELIKALSKQQTKNLINDNRILLLEKFKKKETLHKAKFKKRHKSKLLI